MIEHKEFEQYINELLKVGEFKDYCPNGMQIQGKKQIRRLATAVTASLDVIEQAAALRADALLVHHGYFWKGENEAIVDMKYRRIASLIQNDINLLAYHLPLDCHHEYGNNAELGRLLDVATFQTHSAGGTADLFWSGQYSENIDSDAFNQFLATLFNRQPQFIKAGQHPIRRIAWCSGGAQDFIQLATAMGVDAFISGEISERTYYQAIECGIHYYGCGHHATERYGVQALGRHLVTLFDLEHFFIDSDNPV